MFETLLSTPIFNKDNATSTANYRPTAVASLSVGCMLALLGPAHMASGLPLRQHLADHSTIQGTSICVSAACH